MVDVNIKIPAIEKLIEVTASGIGAVAGLLLSTWRAKKQAEVSIIDAKGKADAIKLIAQAQAEAKNIFSRPQNSTPIVTKTDIEMNTEDLAQTKIRFQERKRLNNLGNIVFKAKEKLPEQVINKPVDPDWIARFFQNIQDISSEEMQQIWACILAGEVEYPGRTSLRTMSVLNQLSSSEANLFNRLLKYNIGGYVYYKEDVMPKQFLNFGKISLLREAGLLEQINNVAILIKPQTPIIGFYCGYELSATFPSNKTELKIPVITLSKAGMELSQFAEHQFDLDEEYLSCLSQFLQSRGHFSLKKILISNQNKKSYFPSIVTYGNQEPVTLTQTQYNNLPNEIKNNGTYYIVN